MQRRISKRLILNTFWLSVLLHLLLLLGFVLAVTYYPEEEQKKSPHLYVPSYVYKGAIHPTSTNPNVTKPNPQKTVKQEQPQQERIAETQQENLRTAKNGVRKQTILSSSFQILQQQQLNAIRSALANTDPIYLVGDENQMADPLIKLMGRALSAHFEYPRTAGELGIKGRVIISLTLHPEGYFSDVTILNSSHNDDLDAAALYAVNKAPVVDGIYHYLKEPKHFVVGFIFR